MPAIRRISLIAVSLFAAIALVFAVDAGAKPESRGAQLAPHTGSSVWMPKRRRGRRTPVRIRPGVKMAPARAAVDGPGTASPASGPVTARPPDSPATPPVAPPPLLEPPAAVPPVLTPPVVGPLDVLTPFPASMRLFSPTSIWNAQVDGDLPLDPQSDRLVSALSNEVRSELDRSVGPWINTTRDSVPVYTVGADVTPVHVTLDTYLPALQRDFDVVPIPAGAHPSDSTDRHLVVYQPATDTLWEFWRAQKLADGWHARWGGKMTGVSTNPGYFEGTLGGSGTSLALLGGLMTIAELKAGRVDHALALAIPNTDSQSVTWPAQRGDGRTSGPNAIPEGTQFRIDPSLDLTKLRLSPLALTMARAAQRYGIVVRDSADCVTFYAEDPTTTSSNPYPQMYGGPGKYPADALRNFPWDSLQVVAPRR
jgi:hypothetical protein